MLSTTTDSSWQFYDPSFKFPSDNWTDFSWITSRANFPGLAALKNEYDYHLSYGLIHDFREYLDKPYVSPNGETATNHCWTFWAFAATAYYVIRTGCLRTKVTDTLNGERILKVISDHGAPNTLVSSNLVYPVNKDFAALYARIWNAYSIFPGGLPNGEHPEFRLKTTPRIPKINKCSNPECQCIDVPIFGRLMYPDDPDYAHWNDMRNRRINKDKEKRGS